MGLAGTPMPPAGPDMNDWSDLVDIHSRLDSTVMFTMIRFVYAVFRETFGDGDIAVICGAAVVASGIAMHLRAHLGTLLLFQVVFSLSSALLAQAVINVSTYNSRLLHYSIQSAPRLLMDFIVVTSLLLGAAVIPPRVSRLPYINRAITILLYMYTDATEYIVEKLNMGITPSFVCILLYLVIVRYARFLATAPTLGYLVKALTMVSINVVLASVGTVNQQGSNRYTQAVLLLIVLFVIDAVHRVTGAVQEGRDFAVWKSSKLLFEIYDTLDISMLATLSIAMLFIVVKHATLSRNSTLVETFLLISVNAILASLSSYTAVAYNMDKILMLFIYVIIIHSAANAIRPRP